MNHEFLAVGMTLIAGLSTGIGGLITYFSRKPNARFLSISLGFSAGVMLYVSMVELFAQSKETLSAALGGSGYPIAVLSFFGGMLAITVIDRLVPEYENPHEMTYLDGAGEDELAANSGKMMRMGLITALAITIHNFPEGMATFVSALQGEELALPITMAIAIHNIPEGVAVAVPIFYATRDRKKAFWYSLLSGLSEPFGAILGYLLLRPFMSDTLMGVVFGAIAGVMVYISLDELLPSAEEYGGHHQAMLGLIAGMAVMAVSLLLFA